MGSMRRRLGGNTSARSANKDACRPWQVGCGQLLAEYRLGAARESCSVRVRRPGWVNMRCGMLRSTRQNVGVCVPGER
jgi:hypothetical protein